MYIALLRVRICQRLYTIPYFHRSSEYITKSASKLRHNLHLMYTVHQCCWI